MGQALSPQNFVRMGQNAFRARKLIQLKNGPKSINYYMFLLHLLQILTGFDYQFFFIGIVAVNLQ